MILSNVALMHAVFSSQFWDDPSLMSGKLAQRYAVCQTRKDPIGQEENFPVPPLSKWISYLISYRSGGVAHLNGGSVVARTTILSVTLHDMVPLKVASWVIKSLLFKGLFHKYIWGLDGSETNLSGPTPPLKVAERQQWHTQNKLDNEIKNGNVRLPKGQANDNNSSNMLDKKSGHAQMQ